jgi:hypothetical protein
MQHFVRETVVRLAQAPVESLKGARPPFSWTVVHAPVTGVKRAGSREERCAVYRWC